jgi:hypothetical protein
MSDKRKDEKEGRKELLKVQKLMERSLVNNFPHPPKKNGKKKEKSSLLSEKDHCANKDKNWRCLKRRKKVFIL